ncbi:MAG: sigma-70 family RNA polymerase sigma factor [Lachnospiraceae bacterium]|nr:sigma-70 family RNA polymerase sigma factor [Lachnospiraceae bacterium]
MNTVNTLVRRARRGDAEAFIALIEECKMTLQRVALGYLRNEEDVADAIQDTILDAYEHIGNLKKEEYFKTWLVRILINRCTKRYRMNQHKAYLEDYSEEAQRDVGKADVEFREMLSILPDDSRVIFQLYYGEQFTIREIAEILGMNENTIKSRLHRGKEQLRVALEGR